MLIMVDVDSTIADLMTEWLKLYNRDYEDSLDVSKINDWAMGNFVKPECGPKIYDYLKLDTLYDNVLPIDGARSGIAHLRNKGHRVVYASSGVYSLAKYKWLERNGFEPGMYAEDYIVVYDKSLLKGDLLVDDRPKNIEEFGSRKSILFNQPWNQSFSWSRRAYSWHDVTQMVCHEI